MSERRDRAVSTATSKGGRMNGNAPKAAKEPDTAQELEQSETNGKQNGLAALRERRVTTKIGLNIHPRVVNAYKKIAIDENTSVSEIVEDLLMNDLRIRGIEIDMSSL